LRLLVYGTLRRGGSREGMLRDARFLEKTALPGLVLHRLGGYPGAVPGDGTVVAELYELPHPSMLEFLDGVEGVHESPPLFVRTRLGDAWIYLYARDVGSAPRIPSGDWLG
jgi:gamma-glutamylcyclotransferase (GGCT)/AIG2-like uncharacterized protein YtfP